MSAKTPAVYPLAAFWRTGIVLLDGAMGTTIQQYKLTEAQFARSGPATGKERISKAITKLLNLTQPQIIEEIHPAATLQSGADIIGDEYL
jgi:5-methyltetrahydrofolate--homocysteine methyltransferase